MKGTNMVVPWYCHIKGENVLVELLPRDGLREARRCLHLPDCARGGGCGNCYIQGDAPGVSP